MKTANFLKVVNKSREKKLNQEQNVEILDDTALIDCINQLNELREQQKSTEAHIVFNSAVQEQEVLMNIEQVSAEMRWFSQWLTVKSNSAA